MDTFVGLLYSLPQTSILDPLNLGSGPCLPHLPLKQLPVFCDGFWAGESFLSLPGIKRFRLWIGQNLEPEDFVPTSLTVSLSHEQCLSPGGRHIFCISHIFLFLPLSLKQRIFYGQRLVRVCCPFPVSLRFLIQNEGYRESNCHLFHSCSSSLQGSICKAEVVLCEWILSWSTFFKSWHFWHMEPDNSLL